MYCKQRGFALITVLIFLEIIAVFSVYAIQSNLWEMKMTRQSWLKQNLFQAAEFVLQHAEHATSNCLTTHKKFKTQSLAWWQAQACTGELQDFQFYYVVEVLEEKSNFRYTALVIPKTNKQARIILQTVVSGTKRQSWRQIA